MKSVARRIETRTWLWAAIGPLLLLLTLSVTTWFGRAPFLPLISLISLPLATLWRRWGFLVGCLFLLVNCLAEPNLWAVGAMAAAGCALFVSHIAFEEIGKPFERMRGERVSHAQELEAVREEFLAYRREAERELRVEQIKLRELAALQAERNALLVELFEARRRVQSEAPDHHLRQLRQQFEERNEILHATRDELWHAESKSLRMEHERANAALEPDPQFDALAEPLEAAASAEEEIEALEHVITKLLGELKSRSVPSLSGFQLPTR